LLQRAKYQEKHRARETHKEKTDKQVVNTKSKISRKTQNRGNHILLFVFTTCLSVFSLCVSLALCFS
jgi:hypothetical protein